MGPRQWRHVLTGALLWLAGGTGCEQREAPVNGVAAYDRNVGEAPTACLIPGEGCPCDAVGEFVECGHVEIRSGDYVTCSLGKRECMVDHVWSECRGEQTTTQYDPPAERAALAVTGPSECVDNVCDPYCSVIEDDGQSLEDLPTGACESPSGGLVLCNNACGYSGAYGSQPYASLPSDWRKNPTSCMDSADACGYDSDCNADTGTCTGWEFPCYDPDPPSCSLTNKIDLTLGPPCVTGSTYHFQVCNRGAHRASSGSFRIGLYTNKSKITTAALTSAAPGAPDAGYVTFTLGTAAGSYIDPGKCIDVTPGNSTASTSPALSLSGTRAVAVNYNATLAECNLRNNWQVFTTTNTCAGCDNLQCFQTNAATTLTGTIYDPAGTNVVPGVVVYVPNKTVLPLTDGVACDTCSNLFSGSPIASAVTGPDGKFTLTNVPAGTNFPLVIQIGRWRRQVTVSSITAGASAVLPAGETSRLPSKKSEGDIPKIAISMSAGDHLQCLLRKIGIEDSEFTAPTGNGRIHLYAFNGMTLSGTKCTAPLNGTCATDLWSSPSALDQYSAVVAPCDKNPFGGSPGAYNPYVGCSSSSSSCPGPIGYGAGPYPNAYGYNNFTAAQNATNPLNTNKPPFVTYPDYQGNPSLQPSPTATHRNNIKAYLDKGGRLFATHWMAYFMTHQSYPAAVNYVFGDYVDKDRGPPDFPFTIDTSTNLGSTLSSWLGSPTVTFKRWRHLSASVNSPTVRLAHGDSTLPPISHPAGSSSGWGGPMVPIFQFDTPYGAPAANQCGRVVVAQSHVSESTSTSSQQGAFPGACATGAMSGEEKAFEFLFFSTTQCLGLVVPPPPSTPLEEKTVTFDYDSDCELGHHPEWQFFSWQATLPSSTSINFQAQTADTQAGLDSVPKVSAGDATVTTTTWKSDPDTIHKNLSENSPALVSRKWLRISATLKPSGTTSPTLKRWRQTFDCKPAE